MHEFGGGVRRLTLFLSAYYAANAIYQGYITVYLGGAGLTNAQIGLIMGAAPMLSIATQPFWGAMGDRARSRSRLLCALSLSSACALLLLSRCNGFVAILLSACLFSAFFTSIQPLGDSVVLDSLAEYKKPFGPVRLAASISFALCSYAAGRAFEGRLYLVAPVAAGALALSALFALRMPPAPGKQRKGDHVSALRLFRIPGMLPLLSFVALVQLTMGYFYTFFPVHFTQLPGANAMLLGTCYLIASASEVPFLLVCDRLIERIGTQKLLLTSAAALLVRWLILSCSQDIALVMASQALHGWGFIVLTVAMAKHIGRVVPQALRARGQTLLSVVSYGLARVAGNFGGGLIAHAIGIQRGFFLMALITALALSLFAPRMLRAPK